MTKLFLAVFIAIGFADNAHAVPKEVINPSCALLGDGPIFPADEFKIQFHSSAASGPLREGKPFFEFKNAKGESINDQVTLMDLKIYEGANCRNYVWKAKSSHKGDVMIESGLDWPDGTKTLSFPQKARYWLVDPKDLRTEFDFADVPDEMEVGSVYTVEAPFTGLPYEIMNTQDPEGFLSVEGDKAAVALENNEPRTRYIHYTGSNTKPMIPRFTWKLTCIRPGKIKLRAKLSIGRSIVKESKLETVTVLDPAVGPKAGKHDVMVAELRGVGVKDSEALIAAEILRQELFKAGVGNVIERQEMHSVRQEQMLQQTGCTEDECAIVLGKTLNARYVILGNISSWEGGYRIQAGAVDVADYQDTSEMIGLGMSVLASYPAISIAWESGISPDKASLEKTIADLAAKLAEAMP